MTARRLFRLLVAVGMVSCLVAIAAEAIGLSLPSGVANEGRRPLSISAGVVAALLLAGLGVLWRERRLEHRGATGNLVCCIVVSLLLLELALSAVDRTVASSQPDSPFGGPYYEATTRDGRPVILKKGDAERFGFRTAGRVITDEPAKRVLFLGDSYTEGSGSSFECNYPQVAGHALADRLDIDIDVLNAGVAGYGPVEAANLLDFLVERGVRFNVVVFSLFTENDFTDNLPGTERIVAAGMPFRVPRFWFLRYFHPLHFRSFHWLLFVAKTQLAGDATWAQTERAEHACEFNRATPADPAIAPPELLSLAARRTEANYGIASRTTEALVRETVARMARTARDVGAAFVLVIFPDRVLVDVTLRSALRIAPDADLNRLRRFAAEALEHDGSYDVTPALADRSDVYRLNDTHLSDVGNRVAGEAVASALASQRSVRRALGVAG